MNSCTHSDIVAAEDTYSGVDTPTVWYNYSIASAGTIKDVSSTENANNLNTATESICPKGWALPTKKQSEVLSGTGSNGSSTYVSVFTPIHGGYYNNSSLISQSTFGVWWGAEARNGMARYRLMYNSSGNLLTGSYSRVLGYYIRCVSEEKNVTDLTYMQDMTASIPFLLHTRNEDSWYILKSFGHSGWRYHSYGRKYFSLIQSCYRRYHGGVLLRYQP